jgi:hypothetical protein
LVPSKIGAGSLFLIGMANRSAPRDETEYPGNASPAGMRREPNLTRAVSRAATQSAYEKSNVVHLDPGRVGSQRLQ